MKTRGITWQVLGVAVLTLWLAAPGISRADIKHRFSFTNDASDSVGGANGTLMGSATVSGGQVVLNDATQDYVDLPIGDTIGNLTNATFETWFTWDHYLGQFWSRIFDFGTGTAMNMFLPPRNGASNNTPRFALTTAGGGQEQIAQIIGVLPNTVTVGTPTEIYIAVTIDADNQIATVYLNGKPAAIIFNFTNTPSLMGSTSQNYLGKSQYNDPYFNGSINEFRIYDRALSAAEIAASFAAGPDATPP